jgi:hypothetical protein
VASVEREFPHAKRIDRSGHHYRIGCVRLASESSHAARSRFGHIAEWHVDFEKIVAVEEMGGHLPCPESRKSQPMASNFEVA